MKHIAIALLFAACGAERVEETSTPKPITPAPVTAIQAPRIVLAVTPSPATPQPVASPAATPAPIPAPIPKATPYAPKGTALDSNKGGLGTTHSQTSNVTKKTIYYRPKPVRGNPGPATSE